jgi:hypothetical protein
MSCYFMTIESAFRDHKGLLLYYNYKNGENMYGNFKGPPFSANMMRKSTGFNSIWLDVLTQIK